MTLNDVLSITNVYHVFVAPHPDSANFWLFNETRLDMYKDHWKNDPVVRRFGNNEVRLITNINGLLTFYV